MKSIFQALTAKNVAGKKSRIMLFFLSLHQQEYLEAKNVGIVKWINDTSLTFDGIALWWVF